MLACRRHRCKVSRPQEEGSHPAYRPFWRDCYCRGFRRIWHSHADHAALQAGLPQRGQRHCHRSHQQRPAHATYPQRIVLFCQFLACSFACGCHSAPRPQVAYDQIVQEIRHGELDVARAGIDRAAAEYGSKNEEWAWRFRILKAQLCVFRREYKEALVVLNESLPPALASTGIAARKAMVEGIAYRHAQQFGDSTEKLHEADQPASSYQPPMMEQTLNNRGRLETEEL